MSLQARSRPPAPSHRLFVLAVSALLAAVAVIVLTVRDSSFSQVSSSGVDNVTVSAMDMAQYRGLRASIIPRATRSIKGDVASRQARFTSYVEALDVATDFARRAGVVAPSDSLLIVLTAAVQNNLTPEGASILLRPYSSSRRIAMLNRYLSLVSQGMPVSSAIAKAALL